MIIYSLPVYIAPDYKALFLQHLMTGKIKNDLQIYISCLVRGNIFWLI
jgi:hypothetical protein